MERERQKLHRACPKTHQHRKEGKQGSETKETTAPKARKKKKCKQPCAGQTGEKNKDGNKGELEWKKPQGINQRKGYWKKGKKVTQFSGEEINFTSGSTGVEIQDLNGGG